MGRVRWLGARSPAILALAAAALLPCSDARAEDRLVVIGQSIHVGPDETLDELACVACSVRLEGEVANDALLILGRLNNQGTIGGSLVGLVASIDSAGPVGGTAVALLSTMRLMDRVDGDAVAVLGEISAEGPNAAIGGDAVSVAGQITGIPPDRIAGSIEQIGAAEIGGVVASGVFGVLVLLSVAALAVLLVVNFLAYLVLGQERLATIADASSGKAALCFLVGLATCFALIVAGLVVAMLLPAGLPVLFVFVVVSVVGYCGLTYGIGRNLLSKIHPMTATMLAATLIILIQAIPLIGWSVMLVIWNVAIGSAVMSGFGTSSDWLAVRLEGRGWDQRATS